MKKKKRRLLIDFGLIAISIAVAVLIVKTGAVHTLMASFHDLKLLGSFFAGMLFTSVFTTAPAIAILGELAQHNSIIEVALLGGVGAVIGDFVIFTFVRDRFSEDIKYIFKYPKLFRAPAFFRSELFRVVTPLLGALIIASPFPDELGLALLGFSKISNRVFFSISFAFNMLGILIIGIVANSSIW